MKKLLMGLMLLSSLSAFSLERNCKMDNGRGDIISIEVNGSAFKPVLVNSKEFFKRCSNEIHTLTNEEQVKSFFQYIQDELDYSQFVGSNVGKCITVDEGYFFIMAEKKTYVGYTGPYELPIDVTEVHCD